jgi:hypothetical protein
MSPKLASVGFSTAAEAAWFEQEVNPEQLGFLERPTSQRRMLIVFAAAFLVIGSVLGVARATTQTSHGAQVAAAMAAPAPLALTSKKPAPAVKTKAAKPVAKVTPAAKSASAKRAVRGKTPAKATARGKASRSGRSTRNPRHR